MGFWILCLNAFFLPHFFFWLYWRPYLCTWIFSHCFYFQISRFFCELQHLFFFTQLLNRQFYYKCSSSHLGLNSTYPMSLQDEFSVADSNWIGKHKPLLIYKFYRFIPIINIQILDVVLCVRIIVGVTKIVILYLGRHSQN